jgi:hypothetical protein
MVIVKMPGRLNPLFQPLYRHPHAAAGRVGLCRETRLSPEVLKRLLNNQPLLGG